VQIKESDGGAHPLGSADQIVSYGPGILLSVGWSFGPAAGGLQQGKPGGGLLGDFRCAVLSARRIVLLTVYRHPISTLL
jgi:hypothetical protein